MWAERRAPSAPTWLLILALHAGLLALLNTQSRLVDPSRAWTELRLIPARPAARPAEPDTATRPDAPHPTEPSPASPPPLPFTVDAAAPEPAPPSAAEPQAEAAPPPLRLTLPAAAASRPLALDDPHGNTPISRFGARIAHDLGDDGRWQEERMDADFVRLRRGNTCVNLHRDRGSGKDAFNESAKPTLWGATPAYRCERR